MKFQNSLNNLTFRETKEQGYFLPEDLKVLKQQIKNESKMFNPCEDEINERWARENIEELEQLTLSCPG